MNHVPGNAGPDGWYGGQETRRRRAGYIAWALVSVAVVGAAGFALVANAWPLRQNTADLPSSAPHGKDTAGLHPTAQSPAEDAADAEQVTTAFLREWSSGAIGAAASLTDDPAAAR